MKNTSKKIMIMVEVECSRCKEKFKVASKLENRLTGREVCRKCAIIKK